MKLALFGAGNMGAAVLKGLSASLFFSKISIYDPLVSSGEKLAMEVGGEYIPDPLSVPTSQIYLIACKPQQFSSLASDLAKLVPSDAIVVSLLAGTAVSTIQANLDSNKIVRVMPNTPALIGEGVNAIFFSPAVNEMEKKIIVDLFASFSKVFLFDKEELIDIVTGFSGSGPAYLFEIARIMVDKLISMGVDHDVSSALIKQTILGAAKLMLTDERPLDVLRNNVTSNKGVTYEALKAFNDGDLQGLFNRALDAAYHRARELSRIV